MHPAKSVILFTTASGAGYGLAILFALFDLFGMVPMHPAVSLAGLGLALLLVVIGLVASTFHLGHPERAWRALTQWRSSWLSREGCMALITLVPTGLYLAARLMEEADALPVLAGATVLCSVLTVQCTAMIYASLKPVPAWATPLTPVSYHVLALASGGLILNALAHFLGFWRSDFVDILSLLLLAGMVVKIVYWRKIGRASATSTAESATGLGDIGKVTLFEGPHDADNYLMKEMGFQIARKHAMRLRRLSLLWGFLFPLLAVSFASFTQGPGAGILIGVSLLTAAVGLFAERWLFFAEAKHAVTLYYGNDKV